MAHSPPSDIPPTHPASPPAPGLADVTWSTAGSASVTTALNLPAVQPQTCPAHHGFENRKYAATARYDVLKWRWPCWWAMALSPDGMVEQAVFSVGLGATVDCGHDAGDQREVQLGGELPGDSQDGERGADERLVSERRAGSVLGGGPGRQFLARTGVSGLVALAVGAGLVVAGGALLVGVRRRFR